jgi:hypothetical protein
MLSNHEVLPQLVIIIMINHNGHVLLEPYDIVLLSNLAYHLPFHYPLSQVVLQLSIGHYDNSKDKNIIRNCLPVAFFEPISCMIPLFTSSTIPLRTRTLLQLSIGHYDNSED